MDIEELKEVAGELKKVVKNKKIADQDLGIVIELLKLELKIEKLEAVSNIETGV